MKKPPDYFYNQAAALPVVETEEGIQIVLISTIKGNWTLPKGVIDPGETPQETAIKEAWEEAGVEGEIEGIEFARFEQRKWGGKCTIRVFILKVQAALDTWPENDTRVRRILPVREALELIVKRQKPVIQKLIKESS